MVSLAATASSTKNARSSSSVIFLPSNSACTIQVSRSSPGFARRSRDQFGGDRVQVHHRTHEQFQLALVAANPRIGPPQQPLGGVGGLVADLALRQAEEAAEDARGQFHRHEFDEVALAEVRHLADQIPGVPLDPALATGACSSA